MQAFASHTFVQTKQEQTALASTLTSMPPTKSKSNVRASRSSAASLSLSGTANYTLSINQRVDVISKERKHSQKRFVFVLTRPDAAGRDDVLDEAALEAAVHGGPAHATHLRARACAWDV
jgi:hypothetical protein